MLQLCFFVQFGLQLFYAFCCVANAVYMTHVDTSTSRHPYPISQAMDVGIVFVIAVNAAVIGIAIDTPHHMAIWEVVEIVPW